MCSNLPSINFKSSFLNSLPLQFQFQFTSISNSFKSNQLNPTQFNSIQIKSIQFNSIQFNSNLSIPLLSLLPSSFSFPHMGSPSDTDALEAIMMLRFRCPHSNCTSSFKDEAMLSHHRENCDKRRFICVNINCGKVYKSKANLKQHAKVCGQVFACGNDGCDMAFNADNELFSHMRVCGAEACPCEYVARNMHTLVLHQTRCKVWLYPDFIGLIFCLPCFFWG